MSVVTLVKPVPVKTPKVKELVFSSDLDIMVAVSRGQITPDQATKLMDDLHKAQLADNAAASAERKRLRESAHKFLNGAVRVYPGPSGAVIIKADPTPENPELGRSFPLATLRRKHIDLLSQLMRSEEFQAYWAANRESYPE